MARRAYGPNYFHRKAKEPPEGGLAREILDAQAAEKDFTRSVIEMLEWHGWRVYHPTDSRLDTIYGETGRGFLDLTAARVRNGRARVIVAELKTEHGRLSNDQLLWLGLWQNASLECFDSPIEVYTWRPSDMDSIRAIVE